MANVIRDWLRKGAQKLQSGFNILPPWYGFAPLWTEWSHERAAREGYRVHSMVYACVRQYAMAAAQVPLIVEVKGKAKDATWQPIPDHPLQLLLDKPFARRGDKGLPNYTVDRSGLMEATAIYLNLSGNSPWILGDLDRNYLPQWIWPARPDRLAPVLHPELVIDSWYYVVPQKRESQSFRLEAEEVLGHTFFDPAVDVRGLGPLQVLARVVDTENEAIDWNKVALQNRMVVDGVFSVPEVGIGEVEFNRMKGQIREKYQGSRNARNPLLLEGGAKWQPMAFTPVEMDFLQSRKANRVEICAAFRVPPELVGDSEHKTYNSFPEARRHFYQDTVTPFLDDICSTVTNGLAIRYGDNVRVKADTSAVPALAEDMKDVLANAKTMDGLGVPMEQINEKLKLGLKAWPGWDQSYRPIGLIPVATTPDTTVERDAANRGRLQGDQAGGNPPEDETPPKDLPKARKSWNLVTEADKTAHWKRWEAERNYFEGSAQRQVEDLLTSHLQQVKHTVLSGDKLPVDWKGRLNTLSEGWQDDWLGLHTAVDLATIQHFGNMTLSDLHAGRKVMRRKEAWEGDAAALGAAAEAAGSSTPAILPTIFDAFADRVKRWIAQNTAIKVGSIGETTLDGIRAVIEQGIANGWTMVQIAKALEDAYEFSPQRAMVVARTETIAASNAGSYFGALQVAGGGSEVLKHWLSAQDDRVRETHVEADAAYTDKGIPLRDAFVVGGAELLFPGDTSLGAPAKETVQCRCTVTYSIPGGEEE